MNSSHTRTIWLTGVAIFSMFFGAGNIIFPLKVGLLSGEQFPFAMTGLLLTAIGGPLLGLITATLYKGNCLDFFCRPGKSIGILFIAISLFLLGPFAVIPRLFVIAASSISDSFVGSGQLFFSAIFALLSLACCYRESWILPLLGRVLSPLLLISLICIICRGVSTGSPFLEVNLSSTDAFFAGLNEGFETMDLIAAIFFSSSIWSLLLLQLNSRDEATISRTAIASGVIAGCLLGLIYIGLGLATATHAAELSACPPEKLMATLAILTLGPVWGQLANVAIAVACFTTVVSLTQTIGSLCQKELFPNTLGYPQFLLGILLISVAFSMLGFGGISALIHPLITICYPAIIVLTIFNLLHKKWGYRSVRRPVFGTLALSAAFKSIYLLLPLL